MNYRIIPLTHAVREITNLSETLASRGLEELFFTVELLCQFLVLVRNRFWFYILMYLEYNTVVVLCYFLVLAGNTCSPRSKSLSLNIE